MPDFISNFITIRGDAKTLRALKTRLGKPSPINRGGGEEGWEQGAVFSLLNIVRPPKSQWREYMNSDDGTFNYNWNCTHWGTKWDVERSTRLAKADSLRYDFRTPWTPPDLALLELSRLYPTVAICNDYEGEMESNGYPSGCTLYKGGKRRKKLREFGNSCFKPYKVHSPIVENPDDDSLEDLISKANNNTENPP